MNILTNKRVQLLSSAVLCFLALLQASPAAAVKARAAERNGICTEGEDRSMQPAGPETADRLLRAMSLEQKVSQLFVLTPEMLTGTGPVTQADEAIQQALLNDPVGGLIYMEQNIVSSEQLRRMTDSMQSCSLAASSLPLLLCVDEEGGSVRRISGRLPLIPEIPAMWSVGQSKDPDEAYETGALIGSYLSELGFNVDFAPVADIVMDPQTSAIADRSFGSNPLIAGNMAAACAKGLQEQGVCATLKHFPGHGAADADSHLGTVISRKSLQALKSEDLIPFMIGIREGARLIMAGHVAYPQITGDDVPASLSHYFLTQLLREEIGYEGLIITDALNMGAVTDRWTSGEAAAAAVCAGADLLLMPEDFKAARQGILDAVSEGRITEERIDASVRRIIDLKLSFGYAAD